MLQNINKIPVISFAGYSNSGKTTQIEKLIPCLYKKGVSVAVIKHDVHNIKLDIDGTDTDKFSKAGAEKVIISNSAQTVIFENKPKELYDLILNISNVDLIIVEGYKNSNLFQIGICRKENNKGFTADINRFEAVICDDDTINTGDIQKFNFEETGKLADFIIKNMNRWIK